MWCAGELAATAATSGSVWCVPIAECQSPTVPLRSTQTAVAVVGRLRCHVQQSSRRQLIKAWTNVLGVAESSQTDRLHWRDYPSSVDYRSQRRDHARSAEDASWPTVAHSCITSRNLVKMLVLTWAQSYQLSLLRVQMQSIGPQPGFDVWCTSRRSVNSWICFRVVHGLGWPAGWVGLGREWVENFCF